MGVIQFGPGLLGPCPRAAPMPGTEQVIVDQMQLELAGSWPLESLNSRQLFEVGGVCR